MLHDDMEVAAIQLDNVPTTMVRPGCSHLRQPALRALQRLGGGSEHHRRNPIVRGRDLLAEQLKARLNYSCHLLVIRRSN